MTKQSLWLIALLLVFVLLFGYNYIQKPFANLGKNLAASQLDTIDNPAAEVAVSPTDELLSTLTPRQKISQLLAVPLTLNETFIDPAVATRSAQVQWIKQSNPGSVVIFGSKVSTAAASVAIEQINLLEPKIVVDEFELKPLVAVDHEGGTVQRLAGAGFSTLKSWAELCKLDSVTAQIALEQSAEELELVGVDVILGPVLDVSAVGGPLSSRICSGDFKLVNERTRLATAVYQSHNIVPVFKHFPGIGQASKDLHSSFDSVLVSEDEAALYRDLITFFQDQPLGVMVAHVGVENQDPSVPCSMSSSCVSQLRSNFEQVLLFSDDILMSSAYQGLSKDEQTLYQVTLRAILAGNHQVIIGPGADPEALNEVLLLIEEAYQKNSFVRQSIDQSVARVIDFKLRRNQLQ